MKHFVQSTVFLVASAIILFAVVESSKIDKDAVTLKEAIYIAEADAHLWQADATVAQIVSTDAGDILNDENGKNGKRRCWNILFVSDSEEKQYSVFVIRGRTAYNQEVQMPTYAAIELDEEVSIDSTDAVKIAKRYGVKPVPKSDEWAVGYHYALQYLTDIEARKTFLAMMVYGVTGNGNFCYVAIDPKSRNVISFMEKTGYSSEGRSIWEEQLENK